MTSFDFDLSEKEIAGSTAIMRMGRKLAAAFAGKARSENLTKAELAKRLEVDKATVSRMLAGNANLTMRSLGELCWAMGLRPEFALVDDDLPTHRPNISPNFRVMSASRAATLTNQNLQVVAR